MTDVLSQELGSAGRQTVPSTKRAARTAHVFGREPINASPLKLPKE
jgi:hypothetical protein